MKLIEVITGMSNITSFNDRLVTMRFRVDGTTFRITMIVPELMISEAPEHFIITSTSGTYYVKYYEKLELYKARRRWNNTVKELEEYVDYVR